MKFCYFDAGTMISVAKKSFKRAWIRDVKKKYLKHIVRVARERKIFQVQCNFIFYDKITHDTSSEMNKSLIFIHNFLIELNLNKHFTSSWSFMLIYMLIKLLSAATNKSRDLRTFNFSCWHFLYIASLMKSS